MIENTRKLAYVAVFGTIWGGAEIFLGGALHAFSIPLKGMIMAALGAFILISARLLIGGKGLVLSIGAIAAFMKLFSLGGLVLSPAFAIILESIIAETVFAFMGSTLTASLTAGAGMVVYTIFHRLFTMWFIYRNELKDFFEVFGENGNFIDRFGVPLLLVCLILYFILHIIIGSAAGALAYLAFKRGKNR